MEKQMNYLDRNEFNFEPSQKVVDAIKNFDPKTLCFYTRIYDEGKKSVISVRVSEIYNVPEEQVLLTYGGEDMLKNAIHYFLSINSQEGATEPNTKILIPEFSWWYYNRVASEVVVRSRCIPCTSRRTPSPTMSTRSLNTPTACIPVCCCWLRPTTLQVTA